MSWRSYSDPTAPIDPDRTLLWRTYVVRDMPGWARCLWCGDRGHFRESCAREHAHGAVSRDGVCLGCGVAA